MPVETAQHKMHAKLSPIWRKLRDCIAGEDEVKAAGTTYLPSLGGMDAADYQAYKARAMFFEATPRTIAGLAGAVFRKDPVVTAPDAARPLLDDVTLTEVGVDGFLKLSIEEVLAVGRLGILVDVAGDASDVPGRPYLRQYDAETIRDWHVAPVQGRARPVQIVLAETHDERGEDEFSRGEVEARRVLDLVAGDAGTPVYRQRIFRKREGAGRKVEWVLEDETVPLRRGQPLEFIPFVFVGPTGIEPDAAAPPLAGLANVNLSHYRTSADLEHGAHFTALPTPYVTGMSAESPELKIGSGTAWLLPERATAGMLEYKGEGLKALENRLERKERTMAVLGARLLEDQKRGVEAAETIRMRHRGENSILAGIAGSVGQAASIALSWLWWWDGADDGGAIEVTLNKDFVETKLAGNDLLAYVRAWQAGAYPKTVLWRNFREGEVIPADMSDEELEDALSREAPLGLEALDADAGDPDRAADMAA